jgi:uncharacterized OB-fold protein
MSTPGLEITMVSPTVRQKIQIPYSYVAGPAVTRFLRGLKDRVITASVCTQCGRRSVPPVSFCAQCWQPIGSFVEVGSRGVLESFAVSSTDAGERIVYALVRLEGADSLLAHVLHAEPAQVLRCGSQVEAEWRTERTGSILDIACFRVISQASEL